MNSRIWLFLPFCFWLPAYLEAETPEARIVSMKHDAVPFSLSEVAVALDHTRSIHTDLLGTRIGKIEPMLFTAVYSMTHNKLMEFVVCRIQVFQSEGDSFDSRRDPFKEVHESESQKLIVLSKMKYVARERWELPLILDGEGSSYGILPLDNRGRGDEATLQQFFDKWGVNGEEAPGDVWKNWKVITRCLFRESWLDLTRKSDP